MAYSELIKNIEKIRAYIRDFYIYGFRTRTDFDQKSARSYDNERRRVESWLGDAMAFRQDAAGKRVFISVDQRETLHNPFYRAFRAKSFTDADITLHFYIMDVLADGERLSARQVLERIVERVDEIPETDFLPDESTVRKKLKEYVGLGLLTEEKQGREILYVRNDAARQRDGGQPAPQSAWQRDGWLDAIAFASEAMPLGVIGSYLLDRYQKDPDYYTFKHHYLTGALDAEVVEELLLCRDQHKNARITFSTRRSGMKTFEALVYPLRIYISTQSGRENLLAYSFDARRPRMYRLDHIRAVRMAEEQPEPEKLDRAGEHFARHLWGTSGGSDRERTLQHIEMKIFAGEEEFFIPNRLMREKRCGEVRQLDAEHWLFTADVYDAMEMMPWIRTFIGRIEELTCSDQQVTDRFYDDLLKMQAMYEGGDGDGLS